MKFTGGAPGLNVYEMLFELNVYHVFFDEHVNRILLCIATQYRANQGALDCFGHLFCSRLTQLLLKLRLIRVVVESNVTYPQ